MFPSILTSETQTNKNLPPARDGFSKTDEQTIRIDLAGLAKPKITNTNNDDVNYAAAFESALVLRYGGLEWVNVILVESVSLG